MGAAPQTAGHEKKKTPAAARVLVATDNVDDANQIRRLLESEFDNIRASTVADKAIADFQDFKPDVLVLAFDSVEKAQHYYLGLYRFGNSMDQYQHRTVLLCTKDEVKTAFELCKKEYFDDYVLYWPYNFDAPRLAMSIWGACREMTAQKTDTPRAGELLAHAKHLGELEATIGRGLQSGEQKLASVRSTVTEVEREIASTIDEFSSRLIDNPGVDWADAGNRGRLASELDRLKGRQIESARKIGSAGVESVSAWARNFREQIEPALSGVRTLKESVRQIRAGIMVVDDDEFIHQIIGHMLDPEEFEIHYSTDGAQALRQLRRLRPDVIFMDVGLPGMDGVSLTQRLKALPHLEKVPIVMITGDARREILAKCVDVGAQGFLVKPFTREAMLLKLEKVLPR
jgi:CheY-like chemotaxis protein